MLTPAQRLKDAALGAGFLALCGLLVYGAYRTGGALTSEVGPAPSAVSRTAPARPAPALLTAADLRNLWENYDPAPAPVPSREAPPRAEPRKDADKPEPRRPDISMVLRGVIFHHANPSASVAFIESGGELDFFRRDETVGEWRVVEITRGSVALEREGERRRIGIRQLARSERAREAEHAPASEPRASAREGTPFGRRPRGIPPPSRFPKPEGEVLRDEDIAYGSVVVEAPGPARAETASRPETAANGAVGEEVPEEVVERLRRNPFQAVREDGVQLAPHFAGQRMEGVALLDVPAGSLASRFGFQSGDRIVEVNGQPLDSVGQAVSLYNQNRNARSVTVVVDRGGQRRELTFRTR